MGKKFDATLNTLIDDHVADWGLCFTRLCGLPEGPVTVEDTDLSTSVQSDRLFQIRSQPPILLHLELEANPRLGIPVDLARYNILAYKTHDIPVQTVLVLLRPKAQASDLTEQLIINDPHGRTILTFNYRIIRVWEYPERFWYENGLGLIPLALLTEEATGNIEESVRNYEQYLKQQPIADSEKNDLLSAAYFLTGLRHQGDRVIELFRGVLPMLETSTTYQHTLQKGEQIGEKKGLQQGLQQGLHASKELLVRMGTKRLGSPTEMQLNQIEAVNERTRIDSWIERVFEVANWDELLAD
jgi:predicted transposase YdaD